MKNLTSKFLILFFLIIGCSDDFGDMNVDPNNPSTAIPDLLLTQSITQMSGVAGAVTPVLYVQYMSTHDLIKLNSLSYFSDIKIVSPF